MKRNPKEYNKHKQDKCQACSHDGSFYPLDIDHVKTLGSGGTNDKSNCMTLCRRCHQEKGSRGITYMAGKYSSVRNWLINNNWEYLEHFHRWIPNLSHMQIKDHDHNDQV